MEAISVDTPIKIYKEVADATKHLNGFEVRTSRLM